MSREALVRALALHAGQPLTPEVGRAIVAMLHPVQPIDCSRWAPQEWRGFTVAAEPWADTAELDALHAAFHDEVGEPNDVDRSRLENLQRVGQLLSITARNTEGQLVGLLRAFIFTHHRTGKRIGCDDLFFIFPAHRGGLLAVRLARFTERCLADLGVEQAELTMRLANDMGRIARFMKYQPSVQRWTKALTPPPSGA